MCNTSYPAEFVWYRKTGLAWRRGHIVDEARRIEPVAQPMLVSELAEPGHEYMPLREHSGLFRTFADLEPDSDAILNFAREFGRLGVGRMWITAEEVSNPDRQPHLAFCKRDDPLDEWQYHIAMLRQLVELWEMYRSADRRGLRRILQWDGGCVVHSMNVETPTRILAAQRARIIEARDRWRDCPRNNYVRMSQTYIELEVTRHLEYLVSPVLTHDPRIDAPTLGYTPENLVAAIWLQFAIAVDGSKEYRSCQTCGRWFEISPDIARTNRIYCNNKSCKVIAYRKRKQQARQMRLEGKTLQQITGAVGSKIEKVKDWLKDVPKGGA